MIFTEREGSSVVKPLSLTDSHPPHESEALTPAKKSVLYVEPHLIQRSKQQQCAPFPFPVGEAASAKRILV